MLAPSLTIFSFADIYNELGGTLLAGQVQVTGGTVQVDRTNAIRRSASGVTILPDSAGTLLPTVGGSGILYPKGAELQLFKGCIYNDGTAEVASLGRFLLEQPVVNHDSSGVTIQSTLKDRAQTVTREPTAYPYATDGTSTADVAIMALLTTYAPRLTQFAFTPTTFVPAVQTFTVGFNVWTAAQSIAADAGMELFFDKVGVCVLRPIPNPLTSPSLASYYGDIEGSILLSAVRTLNIANVPNIVCVQSSGSNISPPIQTFWWDTNPASSTYYAAGPVGPLLPAQDVLATYPPLMTTITSSAISNLSDAQNMANQAGAGYLGTIEGATFTIRDDPSRDADDVITVTDTRGGILTPTNYVLDTVTIDLGTGDLQMTGRLAL